MTELVRRKNMDRLIESAGKYTRTEIMSMEHHDNTYPTTADILPHTFLAHSIYF